MIPVVDIREYILDISLTDWPTNSGVLKGFDIFKSLIDTLKEDITPKFKKTTSWMEELLRDSPTLQYCIGQQYITPTKYDREKLFQNGTHYSSQQYILHETEKYLPAGIYRIELSGKAGMNSGIITVEMDDQEIFDLDLYSNETPRERKSIAGYIQSTGETCKMCFVVAKKNPKSGSYNASNVIIDLVKIDSAPF